MQTLFDKHPALPYQSYAPSAGPIAQILLNVIAHELCIGFGLKRHRNA